MTTPDPLTPSPRPGRLLRGTGVLLAVLLLGLGLASTLIPEPAPPAPTPTTAPSRPSPTPTPPPATPGESEPPEPDPPLMTGSIRVGERPVAIAVDPDAGLGYTANHDGGDVSVLDLASGMEIATLAVPGRPTGVATGPSGVIYVADGTGARVYGVDIGSGRRISTWKVGKRPVALTLDEERERLYVAVRGAVEAYDSSTGRRVARIPVDQPLDVTVDTWTGAVWVLWGGGQVAFHDPATGEWAETDLGAPGATGLDVDGARGRLYLAGPDLGLVERNLDTAEAMRQLAFSDAATGVRVDPNSRIAYLVDPEGNAVVALSVA